MKYLILLLPSILIAAVRVDINNLENGRSYQAKFETTKEANEWISKNESNNSWGKKDHWRELKENENEDDCKEVRNILEGELVIGKECLIPQNFEVTITDITLEVEQVELEEQERKQELVDIKKMESDINKSDKPDWEKKLLIRLIKELK